MGLKQTLRVTAMLAIVFGTLYGLYFLLKRENDRTYNLVVFASTMQGPQAWMKSVVTNPNRRIDGSICFTDFQEQKRVCIKTDTYILAPTEIQ